MAKTFLVKPTAPATAGADSSATLTTKDYVDGKVLTDVPVGAKFTDTVYSHPDTHPASMITGLPTSLPADGGNADTVGGFTVGVNVPADAVFTDTDTITTINGKTGAIAKEDIVALGIPSQDTNTTYSEITTEEIDTGTASTLRTITGRRVKYILDKVQGWIGGLTKSDVGLDNVDNIKQATKVEFDEHLADYASPHQYDDEGEEIEYQGARYRLVIINGEPFLEVVAI